MLEASSAARSQPGPEPEISWRTITVSLHNQYTRALLLKSSQSKINILFLVLHTQGAVGINNIISMCLLIP